MTEYDVYRYLLWAFLALPGLVFILLFVISAPYGRHARDGWGPKVNATWGWIWMEAASPIAFAVCFVLGLDRVTAPSAIFCVLWQLHYLHRSFVFPLRRRGGAKTMPLFVAGNALFFNVVNGYLNGRFLYHFGPRYDATWLTDPRFLLGVSMFIVGFVVNLHSDEVLRNLRKPGETGYKIPRGGLYRWVSAPNYFGEILEWTGFAIATWSLPGLMFAAWTIANLAPRAVTNHRWYRERFPDYPSERRALIPFVF